MTQRDDIAEHLSENSSLKPKAPEVFRRSYDSARRAAAVESGIPLKTFPKDPPFTYAQAIDATFWPGQSIEDRA